jgi:septum site-determining protein MinC
MSRSQKNQLIEFKGNSLSAIIVTLRSLQPDQLAQAADVLFGGDTFFEGDAALLDLGQISENDEGAENAVRGEVSGSGSGEGGEGGEGGESEGDNSANLNRTDWAGLVNVFKHRGLHVIGVRGANDILRKSAMEAGLPDFTAVERAVRNPTGSHDQSQSAAELSSPKIEAASIEPPSAALLPAITPALIIDRPLRSGQQVYARGGDLVVLAAVSSGAEVIADGSIHVYAPLRGRALAGASGMLSARIFTTRFEAELVSIAGVYRTFEEGIPENLSGQPVQIHLSGISGNDSGKLTIVPLTTK